MLDLRSIHIPACGDCARIPARSLPFCSLFHRRVNIDSHACIFFLEPLIKKVDTGDRRRSSDKKMLGTA